MALRIGTVNQSGGQKKTATAINLAAALAARSRGNSGEPYRVLLVDADPQGSATIGLGLGDYYHDRERPSLYRLMTEGGAVGELIEELSAEQFYLLPANIQGNGIEDILVRHTDSMLYLSNLLADLDSIFDFIMLDSPPGHIKIIQSILIACGNIIIPTDGEKKGNQAVSLLTDTIAEVQRDYGVNLNLVAIVPVAPKLQSKRVQRNLADLRAEVGELVTPFEIRERAAVVEAWDDGKSVFAYQSPFSMLHPYVEEARDDYRKLAGLILTRLGVTDE